MIPGVPSGPDDDMARAFLAAVFAALEGSCTCEPCRILKGAAHKLREGLLSPAGR